MPPILPHAGTVLSNVQLVTITYEGYAARDQVEAFGDMIIGSSWYRSVGMEYGVYAGSHVQKVRLASAPASITRDQIEAQIKQLITDQLVPKPAADGSQLLYMIYIPPTVVRGAGLQGIHGYHTSIRLDGVQSPIVVVLDEGGDLTATTSMAAHQLINAVTNPYSPPRDGYYADPPMSDPWSLAQGEIADLCGGETPVTDSGFTLPRVYSSLAVVAGRSPCKPFVDDSWSNVSAEPSRMQMVPKGGSVTFTLTGWSTRELPDWQLLTQVADFSKLTEADMRPEFSDDMINNSTSVTLTLHAPANVSSGVAGGIYVLSLMGPNVHPWAVGFIVQ
ncbi:MAG TPA: hypothetical protein VHN14_28600 [Kofleriaceae bacterium]|nr:hypothetical protein [Kofleriaceae bacterium]